MLILVYHFGWKTVPSLGVMPDFKPQTFISVVIAVRNEEKNIQNCIRSILLNNYPKKLFEIIIVDDYSTDATILEIEKIGSNQIHIVSLENTGISKGGKKTALLTGIRIAKGDFIAMTDGDCAVQKNWLLYFAYHHEQMAKPCLAGLVRIFPLNSFAARFQALDNLATMGVNTAANYFSWHFAANGANLGIEKNLFFRLNGYEGNEHISSGDDMFLIQKVAALDPSYIGVIKHADHIVNTSPEVSWDALLSQRMRWATKMFLYRDKRLLFVFAFLFLFQFGLLLSFFLAILIGKFFIVIFIIQILSKILVDYIFIYTMTIFFNQIDLRKSFLKAFICLLPFNIYLYIKALFIKTYLWKGRLVK